MRLRIDGLDDLGVVREARLALRYAGFVLAEPQKDADYVVTLDEHEGPDVWIGGADGPFERDVINRLAAATGLVILDRRGPPNDSCVCIRIPSDDALRRVVSRSLVEIFLTYVHHPAVSAPVVQSPRTIAIAVLLDRIVQQLIDAEPTAAEIAARLTRAIRPPWWQRVWHG